MIITRFEFSTILYDIFIYRILALPFARGIIKETNIYSKYRFT